MEPLKPSKTVVFVNFSITWGGGEFQHLSLAKEFVRQGHRVLIIAHPQSELYQRATEANIETHTIAVGKISFLNPFILFKINSILQNIAPDAVILNSSLELKHFAFATSYKKYNLIYRRGYHTPIKAKAINKFCFKRLNRVVAISQFVLNTTLKDVSRYCRHTPTVINNGIYPLKNDTTLLPNYAAHRLLAIGRLVEYKQFGLLIEAMPAIIAQDSAAELWIVGEGVERENLQTLIIQLNLQQKVFLKGFCDNISEIIPQCSLFIHPANVEAFGVVFLEAMRQKLPCVTFKGHAGDEIIINNTTGLLISDSIPQELANGTAKLLKDTALLEKMGKAAFQRFNSNYTIEHSVNQYLKLIEQN